MPVSSSIRYLDMGFENSVPLRFHHKTLLAASINHTTWWEQKRSQHWTRWRRTLKTRLQICVGQCYCCSSNWATVTESLKCKQPSAVNTPVLTEVSYVPCVATKYFGSKYHADRKLHSRRIHNMEKSECKIRNVSLIVRPSSAWRNVAPSERVVTKFDIWLFFGRMSTKLNSIKIRQE